MRLGRGWRSGSAPCTGCTLCCMPGGRVRSRDGQSVTDGRWKWSRSTGMPRSVALHSLHKHLVISLVSVGHVLFLWYRSSIAMFSEYGFVQSISGILQDPFVYFALSGLHTHSLHQTGKQGSLPVSGPVPAGLYPFLAWRVGLRGAMGPNFLVECSLHTILDVWVEHISWSFTLALYVCRPWSMILRDKSELMAAQAQQMECCCMLSCSACAVLCAHLTSSQITACDVSLPPMSL